MFQNANFIGEKKQEKQQEEKSLQKTQMSAEQVIGDKTAKKEHGQLKELDEPAAGMKKKSHINLPYNSLQLLVHNVREYSRLVRCALIAVHCSAKDPLRELVAPAK